ncbi:MAG: acyl carrier protein [Gemmatimonadales bacterium]
MSGGEATEAPGGMSLEHKVIEAVAKVAKRKAGEVRLESSFDDLGMDSLDRVCLLFELEQMFDISIPEAAVQGIRTVKDIVNRLGPHLARPAVGGAPSSNPS